jgi:heptosyltransferase-2
MCVPALQALRAQFPAAEICVLARPWVAGLYARETFCDEVIHYRAPRGWKGIAEKRRLAVELRRRRFDCAILLQNAFEAAALVRWARIPTRIGYDRDSRGWLLTHPIPTPKKAAIPPHQRFYYLELLKRAGLIESYSADSPIWLGGAEAAAKVGRERLQAAGISGAAVGVSPGAAFGGAKRWLAERFAESATIVARTRSATLAVFGSSEEFDICEAVCERARGVGQKAVNFAGATTLAEFIELAAACEVFLTNDSGPMHIASALGVPTVAIFGATDHEATGPTGEKSLVIREGVACSPCFMRECPIDHRCMTHITAGRVAQAALDLTQLVAIKVGTKELEP